jgi:hypothetical protein
VSSSPIGGKRNWSVLSNQYWFYLLLSRFLERAGSCQ